MSTWMDRVMAGMKSQSATMLSQLPSNSSPTSSPRPFKVGEPELPPVASRVLRKFTGTESKAFT